MNAVLRNARGLQHVACGVNHGLWSAQKVGVRRGNRRNVLHKVANAVCVESAKKSVAALVFAAQHVVHLEASHEAILEVFKVVFKQDAGRFAVAIKQKEFRFWFALKGRFNNGEHRSDSGSCSKAHVAPALGGVGLEHKVAHGIHYVEPVARLEVAIGPGGEDSALDLLNGHAQLARQWTGAERVGAANVGPVYGCAQGEVLAGEVAKGVGVRLVEGQHYGVDGLGTHLL